MNNLKNTDNEIYTIIEEEKKRQMSQIELIASENFVSEAVLEALGSVMTNKYAEGYPAKRYYGGCEVVDKAERLAIERAKELFGCEHVNVQPHSGSQANMAVYYSVLKPGDTLLGMSLSNGGHLTHGATVSFSGSIYNSVSYGLNNETELIDYDEMRKLALEHKPKLIVAGASAYPRFIDFEKIRSICDEVGALMMVDIAHIAGLVAAGLHPSPVPMADFVTTTTHKTLRGPRGGMIMCKEKWAKQIDKAIFPGLQGGPLMHVIAAKAVAFKEALDPSFKIYQENILKNSQALSQVLMKRGFRLITGGTDNHLMLVDIRNKGVTGKIAEKALDKAGITANKNSIPNDPEKPFVTSGLRLGTAAVTTRGMGTEEMEKIAGFIDEALSAAENEDALKAIKVKVLELCDKFPFYKN